MKTFPNATKFVWNSTFPNECESEREDTDCTSGGRISIYLRTTVLRAF